MAKVTLVFEIEDVVVDGEQTVSIDATETIQGVDEEAQDVETSRLLSWILRSIPEYDEILEEATKKVFNQHMLRLAQEEGATDDVSGQEAEAGSSS